MSGCAAAALTRMQMLTIGVGVSWLMQNHMSFCAVIAGRRAMLVPLHRPMTVLSAKVRISEVIPNYLI
jgi:predicted metalloenzyme YecM